MPSEAGFISRSPQKLAVFGPIDGEFYYSGGDSTANERIQPQTLDGLDALIEDLTTAIVGWITTTTDWDHRGEDERAPALEALRTAGHNLFIALEGNKPGALQRVLKDVTYLEVKVRKPHIPWEFLYLGGVDDPVDLGAFLGSRAVVGRPFDNAILSNNPSAPANDVDPAVSPTLIPGLIVGVAEDEQLDSARSGDERRIFSDRNIAINLLPPMYAGGTLATMDRFLEESPDLTHFNCHATDDAGSGKPCALRVTDRFEITRQQLSQLTIREGSMVVLNCCFGHTLRHASVETIATAFARGRVSAVVASTNRIVDDYATRWAEFFYEALFEGQVVGRALLIARQRLIAATGNPACLVYCFLGRYGASLNELAA